MTPEDIRDLAIQLSAAHQVLDIAEAAHLPHLAKVARFHRDALASRWNEEAAASILGTGSTILPIPINGGE